MTVEPLLRLLGTQPAQVLSALLISLLVGLLVSAQAQRLGQDAIPLPGLPAWRWSRLAGALGTWLCALGLLQLAVPGLTGAGAVLELVGRVGLAAASLLLGAWLGQARVVLAEDGDRASREAAEAHRWPALAVGASGALLALSGGHTALLLVLGVALLLGLLLTDSAPARALAGLLRDLAAGVELRARLRPGSALGAGPAGPTVSRRPGLLTTWIEDPSTGPRARANAALLDSLREADEDPAQRSRTST